MSGIRLGTILGLEVRVDYSWFVIFALLLWSLSIGVFPAEYPGRTPAIYFAMGISATLLFFASLLTHEIAHSLVAKRRGIPVEGITLFIFGGMAHTRLEAENPRDEFIIAGVGPLASLVIAVLFATIAWLTRALGASPTVTVVARYLALINMGLAIFNLLPGFPLDGGRLFRAAIWKRTGDLTKATHYATTGGKWVGYAIMGVGALEMFVLGVFGGGLWLLFIGWFVRTAAEASLAQHLLLRSLEGIRVRDLMTAQPQTVSSEISIQEFVDDFILRARFQAYPVVEDSRPLGLIALQHVKPLPREEWAVRTVRDVMTPLDQLTVVTPNESVSSVLPKLAGSTGGRVLVVRDDHIEGLITRSDLTRWLERSRILAGN
jgi:Zn-dependent protease/CBS domain-containing protein